MLKDLKLISFLKPLRCTDAILFIYLFIYLFEVEIHKFYTNYAPIPLLMKFE